MNKSPVATISRDSMANNEGLKKVRTLRGGVAAMRKAGPAYLPQEPKEKPGHYKNRLDRSWLFPALDEAIEEVADRVFANPVTLSADVPTDIQDLSDNITAEGRSLNEFSRDLFEDGVEAGISYILVDAPMIPVGMTIAEERRANIRPYLMDLKTEQIIGWKTERRGSDLVLSQVRIKETGFIPDPKNKYEDKEVEQIRVMTLEGESVSVQIWRQTAQRTAGADRWEVVESGVVSLPAIPLVAFYTKRTGFFQADPPYEKLADLNIAHWQSASDQRSILHFARVPVMVFFGFESKGVAVAPNQAVSTTKPPSEADVKIVEITGKAIEEGRNDLRDLEERMKVVGMSLMMPTPGNPTATGRALDQARANTPLASMAQSLQDALETALGFVGMFLGEEPESTKGWVVVNDDFGGGLGGNGDLDLLLKAVNTGRMSLRRFLTELVRRGILGDDFDIEEELSLIEQEAPDITGGFDDDDDDDDNDDDDDDDDDDEA